MDKVEKPWGWYIDLFRTEACVKKILFIRKGEEISFQFHKNRKEVWRFLEGRATMKLAASVEAETHTSIHFPGSSLEIAPGVLHQVIAEKDDVMVFETQIGVCNENDIIRVGKDKYGRL